MYLETYSMEELMELIEEKGYCSVEAVEILKEMEQAKKEYDFLLRDCKEKAWKTDQVVVEAPKIHFLIVRQYSTGCSLLHSY